MKKTLLLLGPTGVGKTSASLLLAQHLRTEIISSDSMQIYRGMNIGTAKPTPQELKCVCHHMIDIIEPWERYSAGDYLAAVIPIMQRLHINERVPLVVGGTGLYLKAMTRGIFQGPAANIALRNALQQAELERPGTLYQQLQKLDPAAAARIMPNDLRRIIRALEVCLSTGMAMSDLQQQATTPLPYTFIKIGLTRDRSELYRIIDKRVDVMLQQGLVDEARSILEKIRERTSLRHQKNCSNPSASPDRDVLQLPALQAIGYKELIQYFAGKISLQTAIDHIKQRSRNYAKRQFTWFRQQESDIIWVDITGITDPELILKKVLAKLPSI
jgi:tRNA dimethylallyltransferase